MALLLLVVFVVLFGLAVIGRFGLWPSNLPETLVTGKPCEGTSRDVLFVLVHGWRGGPEKSWAATQRVLRRSGDVLTIGYPASTLSSADPEAIARGVSEAIQKACDARPYREVILVGHSVGGLIARRALLVSSAGASEAESNSIPWAQQVSRIVLLAGTNRGWDVSGTKPADMTIGKYGLFCLLSWFGRMTGTGQLILDMETGAPFVSNLRLEWMRWYRDPRHRKPLMVQLLGDIDDVVSEDDNKDLRAVAGAGFIWLRVRGTGHMDILDMGVDRPDKDPERAGLAAYRAEKFRLAVLGSPDELARANEEQPFETDDNARHVVFILHGIRDLGRWSAEFETSLVDRFRHLHPAGNESLRVASVRYGYFGMGPFILRRDRQKYVRWFMDRYTETMSRYPNAERIDFVGHSNGTYLLASALERYRALKVDRVVFAGSVVRDDYRWDRRLNDGQVKLVRNYVAAADWVVGLFPRFFEQRPFRYLGNDVGSAGFNGFTRTYPAVSAPCESFVRRAPSSSDEPPLVENVGFIPGAHSAFRSERESIVQFLLPATDDTSETHARGRDWRELSLQWVSNWACWVVWLVLVDIVIWVGWRVMDSAGHLAVPFGIAYAILIVRILLKI